MDRRRRGSSHRRQRQRGPKAPDDDRLWRRLHDALGQQAEGRTPDDPGKWCVPEKATPPRDRCAACPLHLRRVLSEATKRGQRLTRTDAGVRLRSKETIEAASKARQRWQAHLDGTEGPNEVLTEVLHCWLLEAPTGVLARGVDLDRRRTRAHVGRL